MAETATLCQILEDAGFSGVRVVGDRVYGNRRKIIFWTDD